MLYALICTDRPGSLAARKENRPAHLAYLKGLGDAIVFAGPFTEPDGQTMNGSLIVVEAVSLEAAQKISSNDPFSKLGIFASVDIRPWLCVVSKTKKEARA